jgi:hypothetical protein
MSCLVDGRTSPDHTRSAVHMYSFSHSPGAVGVEKTIYIMSYEYLCTRRFGRHRGRLLNPAFLQERRGDTQFFDCDNVVRCAARAPQSEIAFRTLSVKVSREFMERNFGLGLLSYTGAYESGRWLSRTLDGDSCWTLSCGVA